MRLPRPTPRTYRMVTLAALLALAFIVVTGGAVRLTGSGLGCPEWPTCEGGRITAPSDVHAQIEWVNRLVTGAVSVCVILAVLGALVRVPRRRDLTLLALGLVGGVLGQIVLGGLTVLFHLAPGFVMSHFLLSMVLLLDAVVLHHRAGLPDDRPTVPVVGPGERRWAQAVVGLAAAVLVLGTVVTGTGPHPGSRDEELAGRFPWAIHTVVRFHGVAVMVFLAAVVVLLVRLLRHGAPRPVLVRAEVLLAVLVAQATIGYVQYFNGVPALLVGFHIAGAAATWIATLRLLLALRAPTEAGGAAEPPARRVLSRT